MYEIVEKAAPAWARGVREGNIRNAKRTGRRVLDSAKGQGKKRQWSPAWGLLESASPKQRAATYTGAAAATGGGVYMANRRRKKNVEKSYDGLIDPFAKAYRPDPGDASNVRVVSAIVPTGRHVGRANKLVRVKNSSGGGGKATRLERYGR